MKNLFYLTLILTILLIGCERVDISKYDGDGNIKSIGSYFISYGYEIDFGQIDLSKPYAGNFKLKNLPEMDKGLNFGIKVISDKEDIDQNLNGKLSISIVENNLTLFEVSGKLTEWNFSKTYHSGKIEYFISFYKRGQRSYLAPEKVNTHKEYQYNIEYAIEPSATDIKIPGVIMVIAGGSK